MNSKYNVLIMGASYGSLLSTKLLMAGHNVTLACSAPSARLINEKGTRVRFQMKGRAEPLEIASVDLPGHLSAATPSELDARDFDLAALAMQEPQYASAGVRELLDGIARGRVPCVSIMNMPPWPYLARIPGLELESLKKCYTDASVWENFDPALITLASPDPQAYRPPDEGPTVLHVGLPTNFKVTRFDSDEHTKMLHDLERDIDAARYKADEGEIEIPVKLRVHESPFVPMAKWSMLLTGNYRSVGENDVQPIREAVHGDLELARSVYDWVCTLCQRLGASQDDLVPFEKYAEAAKGLKNPSSVARAVAGGGTEVERVDCLVRTIASQIGMSSEEVDRIVARLDRRLGENRAAS